MRKLLISYFPLVLIFSLYGCFDNDRDVRYITPDLRKISYVDRYTGEPDTISETRYEIRIEGYWYPADENGDLTPEGKIRKQDREMQASNQGGGGC